MKVCTAEFPDEVRKFEQAVETVAAHVAETRPDLLVLPEMPFTPWVFCVEASDPDQWAATVENHDRWLQRLVDAVPTPIITSRPTNKDGKALNEAFFLDADRTLHPLRSKSYLPNDFPAVERVWFDEGDTATGVFDILGAKVGVQLCSEIMYPETPRLLGAEGAEIVVQSRATGDHPRWRAASVLGASTSGAFVVGANRRSEDRDWFTGASWVYSPQGELLGESSAEHPCVTVEIDLNEARAAKAEYPLTMFEHYRAQ